MSQYSNGQQPYYGQSTTPQASIQPATGRYDAYSSQNPAPDQHLPRRMPSYNAGDDSSFFNPAQAQNIQATEGNRQYSTQSGGYGSSAGQGGYNVAQGQGAFEDDRDSRYSQTSSDTMSQISPSRASSQASSLSYRYQYSGAPASQPAYNPQQYGLPHTQSQPVLAYNPHTYTGSSNASYAAPVSAHQPYNPAAYQSAAVSGLGSPALPRRQSATSHYGQTPPTPQSYGFSQQQQQPPLPPPRGPDHPYGGRSYQPMSPNPMSPNPTSPNPSPSYVPSSSPGMMPMPPPTSRPYYNNPQGTAYDLPSPQYPPAIPSGSFEEQPPMPPVHQTHANGLYGKRPSVSHSGTGRSLPTPPGQSDLPLRTDTLTRHPQSRPLPGPPVDEARTNGNCLPAEAPMAYEDVLREDEMAALHSQNFAQRHNSRASHASSASNMHFSPDEEHTHTNGNMETAPGYNVNHDAYCDENDYGAAGAIMMEEDAAREERLQGRRRRETNASVLSSHASNISPGGHSPHSDPDEDNYFIDQDIGRLEGGYPVGPYGEEPFYNSEKQSDPAAGNGFQGKSGSFRSSGSPDGRSEYYDEYGHPALAYEYANRLHHTPADARVDAGGTGGLAAPDAYSRRMSFDYGDEGETPDGQTHSGDQSDDEIPYQSVPEDLFFHPGMRPLPPAPVQPAGGNVSLGPYLMPAGTYNRHSEQQDDFDNYSQYNIPSVLNSADSYGDAMLSPSQVPRSSSLSTPIGPRADAPTRSKTDADRLRYRQQQQELSFQLQQKDLPDEPMPLDLPTIPHHRRKKFHPAKLSSEQFKKCSEPWALSSLLAWIKDLSEDETDLREQAIADAMVALFTHKVPTMNIADAETLAARVVSGMLEGGALVKEEEWVKFGPGTLSGILFQITGTGCYSPRLHLHEMHIEDTDSFGRCYSHHCMRTLKKVNLKAQMMAPQKKTEDWVTFYKVPKEVLDAHPKKEIDRQNNLHEIVTTEDSYIAQLDVLRELYRDQLAKMNPPIMPAKRLPKFLADVFGKVDAVKKVNEDFLLAQLKYRQKEQGPFISGFSDIFREWIRKAKNVYIDYAATFPTANYLVRKEAERNPHFKQFLNVAREHKLSGRLGWDTYLKAPITRIQRYTLLLTTFYKNMDKDSEEKTNVAQAIEEIKVVALECDNKVGEMNKKADLMELASKLQLRPEMKKEVVLNLEHLGRQIIHRGELQRPGTRTRFLVDTHAILFDHYLVLAKIFTTRDQAVKYERYDISKLPIPMDLLGLESTDDDPVIKSSVRGVSTITPSQAGAGSPLTHTGSGASGGNAGADNSKDDKILYPFKIKHLGKTGTYTLYAFSAQSRIEWCQKIIEAKTKHAAALFSQNAEPFRLRVLADTAFGCSDHAPGSKSVTIKGTPLHRAVKEVEKRYESSKTRPPAVCKTAVNCATVFQQPPGRIMCAIGTDYGLYMSELNNPRGWSRAIPITRVTQVAVFEDFNLLLLIADRSLIAYHLDVVCPANGKTQSSQDSARRAPQKLSGNREVGFFAAGRLKDRYLVLYKKREGLSSTFKVLEPVLQKSSTNKSRMFSRRSQTEFFRDYDEFYIPAETYRINMFHSSLAISTQKGIEVLTLDKKLSWSVPDFSTNDTQDAADTLQSIANRISGLKPLGMFRLSESEFLVAYQQCAVYVNKHGDVSRSVVMEFVGSAHTACLYGKFLILFNEDFVEVRNAMNGRLRQVIPGRNVVCIDDGSKVPGSLDGNAHASTGGSTSLASGFSGTTNGSPAPTGMGNTVKICMQHPEYERSQIVLELIENEGQKD
ncbi:uncharacterized protein N7479_005832 [Penicillium vulpinum]|uniref:DH domain-containing protein n=1 Tax=Penicillium vulpinum TaxID=29845 RepID=A0A1V6SEB3_9EURO|nr:uncharacterized protein N7479_005832 [Penicillium vulpinum]KAJ5958682.1 hypothetical protein N7479_005832 [Penicillium vulpinum]OQE12064.1 hypothetical protein PENVUL_c001G03290 [Penicillium vulpinum]